MMDVIELLSSEHLKMLKEGSAISDEVIMARGYQTIYDKNELRDLGFSSIQCRTPGLLLPLWTTDGQNAMSIYRPDSPRIKEDKRKKNSDGTWKNTVIKYEISKGASVRLDCPPRCHPQLSDPKIPLWITEGQKKADCLASHGLCSIALLGVWNFKGKNKFGSSTFLADWDYIALNKRKIRIVFDSDVMTKHNVQQALDRLITHLERKGAYVDVIYLPPVPGVGKVGIDDWLSKGHTVEELKTLIEAPRPLPKPADPIIELLDHEPLTIKRPLVLINGRSYAAAWIYVKVTTKESINKNGEIIRHVPPIESTESRLFIVRNDGVLFGDSGHKPINELGLNLHLPEKPQSDKIWSTIGIKAYTEGYRPEPAEVFRRVIDVVDRFIDFEKSLADQNVMSEMVACYILSTWLLDAFNVIGFLWPNGDRGSGKTHLLLVITELAYLGQLILSGGSFASLRDMADYGATLGFDDAESLGDPRKNDPDKRALLMAGNRRGVTVPLKEQAPNKKWYTRHVNAFCPRLFSAIRLPDTVLASRTIIIPLIRTPDRYRANADPLDYSSWPHNKRQLIDDLWALGLTHLPELPKWDEYVSQNAKLTGRNLQPWRSILAVAAWLNENKVPGLWGRMNTLSVRYQEERPDLELSDMTYLTIQALAQLILNKVKTDSSIKIEKHNFSVKTSDVAQQAVEITKNEEGTIDPDKITSQRMGHVLRKMRLKKVEREKRGSPRGWNLSINELRRWALSYGIRLPDELKGNVEKDISQIKINKRVSTPYIGDIGAIGDIGEKSDCETEDKYEDVAWLYKGTI